MSENYDWVISCFIKYPDEFPEFILLFAKLYEHPMGKKFLDSVCEVKKLKEGVEK
jgi:hypothetical protein